MRWYAGCLYLHWPALSRRHGEERQEGPENVIVVKLVLLPLSGLSFHTITVEVQKLTPERQQSGGTYR